MPLKVFRVAHFLLEIFSLRVEAMRLDLDLLLAVGGTLRLNGDGLDLTPQLLDLAVDGLQLKPEQTSH